MIFLENNHFRIRIEEDRDAQNPFHNDEGMGNLTEKREVYIDKEDAVWFKRYRDQLCQTSMRDFVTHVWTPNDVILEELKGLLGDARREKCIFFAEQAVETYNQWASGECYGYIAEKKNHCDACGHDEWEEVESCWGFYGEGYVKVEAQRVFETLNKTKDEQND